MEQLRATWTGIGLRNQMIAAAAVIGVFGALIALSRTAMAPDYALLYSGLEPAAAGEVVANLEQRGVPFEVRGNGIYVDRAQQDLLRIALANEGLPAAGGGGYELLDNISGFGTTSQMFDATYWRAKEGELARTIASSPSIRTARVHVSAASARPFEARKAPTASVFLTPARGALSAGQADALRYLVSSAVAGMTPENVSIIDAVSGTMLTGDGPVSAAAEQATRSDALKLRIERLLEARVGPGNAIVEVNLDTELDRERIFERTVDPDGAVAVSTEVTESLLQSSRDSEGAVSVSSNLPDGDATSNSANDSQNETETRERVNYEVSETKREIERNPGAVKRVTVAVLVNGMQTVGEDGEVSFAPRPEAELIALEDLVKSTVGFDETRGDVITIKSMEMPGAPVGPPLEQPAWFAPPQLDIMSLVQMGALALVTLFLGLFVIRPILRPANAPAQLAAAPDAGLPAPAPESRAAARAAGGPTYAAAPAIAAPASTASAEAPRVLTGEVSDSPDLQSTNAAALAAPEQELDPVTRLRQLIKDRESETIEILSSWINDSEEVR